MTNREKLEADETKQNIIATMGYRCEVCGNPVNYFTAQIAHRIPQTRAYMQKYGKDIMHHPFNLAVTCCLKCNSAVLLNPATNPIKASELIKIIKEDLNEE